MSRRGTLTAIAAIALSVAAAPVPILAVQTPEQQRLIEEAGVAFPERLGEFRRTRISSVTPGRVGATYAGPYHGILDIFVSPIGEPLAAEFASTETMIGRLLGNLRPVRDLAPPSTAPGAIGRLWTGESPVGPVYTGMMLAHRRGWRIKVRVTMDAVAGESGWAQAERAIREFDWGDRGNSADRSSAYLSVRR